jgi:NAD(P)-dependent dehydrogenase (short-subunit alcohol dehydrogenase family)
MMKQLGGGAIVNFSSIAWKGGAANMPAYATAKAAIIGLTRALARGFGADNIRVNAIEPGAVITERQKRLWYKTRNRSTQWSSGRSCSAYCSATRSPARCCSSSDDSR